MRAEVVTADGSVTIRPGDRGVRVPTKTSGIEIRDELALVAELVVAVEAREHVAPIWLRTRVRARRRRFRRHESREHRADVILRELFEDLHRGFSRMQRRSECERGDA